MTFIIIEIKGFKRFFVWTIMLPLYDRSPGAFLNRLRRGIFAESTILSSLNRPRTNTEQFCQRENHVYKENHRKLKRLC